MNIILPDNSVKSLPENATGIDAAQSIGPRLAKEALAIKVNGKLCDLAAPLSDNAHIAILTFDSDEGKSVFWHTFPSAKIAIGPAIDNGFYYDFDVDHPFTPQDLQKIEARCKEIVDKKTPIERLECGIDESVNYFNGKSEPYKVELLHDIEGPPSMYRQGQWQDLCRGPHLPNTGYVKAMKLLNVAGAYWRGSEKNKMLQRIYGISFPKQAMLDEHLRLLEEAQKRDHRKLGKELDLFSFHSEGAGFPFWHGNGMVLYNAIMDFCRSEHQAAGYQEVKTPQVMDRALWEKSGHWENYHESMFTTSSENRDYAVKPMNSGEGAVTGTNIATTCISPLSMKSPTR